MRGINMSNQLVEAISSAKCEPGEMIFWWLGQSGYAIKISGKIIYIDGFFTDIPGRSVPPKIYGNEISNADIIMGTHDHLDHIDRAAWADIAVASPQAVFIVPAGVVSILSKELPVLKERLIGINDGHILRFVIIFIASIGSMPIDNYFFYID
jgi:L-ascorbate metabolism protein UlaG (beta-lactamase superfamily)